MPSWRTSDPFQDEFGPIFHDPETAEPRRLAAKSLKSLSPYVQKKQDEIKYHDAIIRIAGMFELDPALIKAVIQVESGFNSRAVSHRGACGLMQLMPMTAHAMGVTDSYDPNQNIKGGSKYIRQLMDYYKGDLKLTLAAYNAGRRYVNKYKGIPPFKSTQVYVEKVLKYYQQYADSGEFKTNTKTARYQPPKFPPLPIFSRLLPLSKNGAVKLLRRR
jgi:soluble lytic murein transglycosylase-like protein